MKDTYIKCLKEYSKGSSLVSLSKKYNLDRRKITKYIKDQGVEITNRQNMPKFNYSKFEKIDSEEKAYWLGFLYADGYLSKGDRNVMELSLALKDTAHLHKFEKFMESSHGVKTDHFRCRITMTNKINKENLVKLGCTPRKSLTLKFPTKDQVPKDLMIHFIRGYFDGDGHIGEKLRDKKNPAIFSLLGTRHFLEGYLNFVNIDLRVFKANKNGSDESVQTRTSGYKAFYMLELMYQDATIYLDRKYEKYLKLEDVYKYNPKKITL